MSKYAPPNAEGMKPWVVTIREWGNVRDRIVYAETARQAKYDVIGSMRYVTATARRATPDDMPEDTA